MEHAHGANEGAGRADLARRIMRRQARLGLRIAAAFVLIGLPLLNLYQPELMSARIGGFSLTWLLLAVLFYPVTWLLSWLFVRGSDRAEDDIVRELRGEVHALLSPPPAPSSSPDGRGPSSGDEEGAKPKRRLFVEDDEA